MKKKCPSCDSDNTIIELPHYHNYDLIKCSDCLCVFSYPFEAPKPEFYSNGDDSESMRRHSVVSHWHKEHPTWNSKLLTNGNGKKLLDIGCGNGDFAEFASNNGFEITGIDIDTSSLTIAKSRNLKNTQFINTRIQELVKLNYEQFDIITMFEVFEHVDNPKETIELIKKLLKPNGYFVGTLPNENRYLAKILNLKFALPPYHITYWTKHSWTNYLENVHSFKKENCENNAYYGYISNILFEKTLRKFKIKNSKNPLHLLFKIIFMSIKEVEKLFEKATKNASSFYFEFKKND